METLNFLNAYITTDSTKYTNRYLPPEKIVDFAKTLSETFQLKAEGKSVLENTIYSVNFGKGTTKILMWSQMHGNESTTTKAVFDFLHLLDVQKSHPFYQNFFEQCSLKIIFQLNPDGAQAYTRLNANEVDLNRDAQDLSQPESKILRTVFEEFSPDFCFNLHDQRTIFSVGATSKPATLSFLAPAYDENRTVNNTRKKAMQLIAAINARLQQEIAGQIGRYDDTYNANCVGDSFQKSGVPTLLFEAGHFSEDYQRNITRKYICIALFEAIKVILDKSYTKFSVAEYTAIPQNEKLFYDVLIRNVKVGKELTDIAIQYHEKLKENKIHFLPFIEKVESLATHFGHREIEGYERVANVNNVKKIKKGIEIKKIRLNEENFLINLTNY